MQLKIFTDIGNSDFEDDINSWLDDRSEDIKVVKIKQSLAVARNEENQDYSILLISVWYEEKKKERAFSSVGQVD